MGELRKKIAQLIQTGELDGLKILLKEDSSWVNGKTEQGISFLTLAAYCRNQEAIDLIKENKAEIDLYEAVAIGDLNVAKDHLDKNPELINSYSIDGFTPLGLACFFGHFKMVDRLIKLGAEVNVASNNDFKVVPLHSACAISNYQICQLLINSGADVNAKQQSGLTPLHAAAHNGQIDIIKMLLNAGATINTKTQDGKTPLLMAQEKTHVETAAFIKLKGGI